MTPRGRGADRIGIDPMPVHCPEAHLIEHRNEDSLLVSVTGEAEAGSAGEQLVEE